MYRKILVVCFALLIAVSCTAKDDNPFAPQNIIDDLEFDLSKDEVREKYAPYEPVELQADTEIWRFDILNHEEYEVANDENESDIDYMGLFDQELLAQLFVQWDHQGSVEAYSVYYLVDDDRIHHYHLTVDGEEREQLVFQRVRE